MLSTREALEALLQVQNLHIADLLLFDLYQYFLAGLQ